MMGNEIFTGAQPALRVQTVSSTGQMCARVTAGQAPVVSTRKDSLSAPVHTISLVSKH